MLLFISTKSYDNLGCNKFWHTELHIVLILAVEHNVGVPMMGTRRGVAFPGGDAGSILSPRDTAGLGVKMVEYVLGGSPTGT